MEDVMSVKEAISILKELIGSQHGNISRLAMEKHISHQAMAYKIKSLCKRMEKLDKEVHGMFFLLGHNISTQYRILEKREEEKEPRKEPEYLRDFTDPNTDPRAMEKFKYYIEKFLKDRSSSGYLDVNKFRDSLKRRYKKLRRVGLSRLVDELEKLRKEVKMDLDNFYQLVSRFVEKKNGKLYHFGWLFNAGGDSDQHNEFIERVKQELAKKDTLN